MKIALPILTSLLCAGSAHAVLVDFASGTDFANNFRLAPTQSGHTIAQTGEFLTVTSNNAATTAVAYVYDTTPANNTVQNTFSLTEGQSISVSLDFANLSANSAGGSIGFYFLNPTAESSAVNFMALININSGGPNELFRFASGSGLTSTLANGSLSNGSPNSVESGLTVSDTTFRTITATYTYNSASSISMSLVAGSVTSTRTYTSVTALSNVAIAFRVAPITGIPARTVQIDNFTIVAPSAIPEPSTYAALAGLAMLGFAASRRSRR